MSEEVKKAADFINETMTEISRSDDEAVFQVVKTDYRKYMKQAGIPEDVLKQVSDAHSNYVNGAIMASKDQIVNNGINKVTIRTRTDGGRIDVEHSAVYEGCNPRTGEKIKKYGSVSVKTRSKTLLDKEILKQCEEEIEKAFNKKPKTLKAA